MPSAREVFDTLNTDYLTVHKTKEDLFWDTYMAVSNDDAGFARAEEAYKNFISDPARLASVRDALASLPATDPDEATAALRHGLKGWLALFEANIVDSDAARQLMGELIKLESDLFAARRGLVLQHINEAGQLEDATLSMLSTNLSTNPVEAARKSSHDALMSLERWVLEHGLLDIVKKRNAFARAQGFDNYFDYKVQKNEQMSSDQLFTILDDFEERGVNLPTALGLGASATDAQINMVPMIDLLVSCIAFLLMTAVWTQIGAVQASQPRGAPAPDQPRKPVYKRGWFWGVISVVVVAAAVTTAVVLTRKPGFEPELGTIGPNSSTALLRF